MADERSSTESQAEAETESGGTVPPPDRLYRALGDATRRQIVYHLLGQPSEDPEELVDVLAGWQATREGMVGPEERHEITVSLHHIHLPLLREAGLVDTDDEEIRLSALAPPTRELIRAARTYDRAAVAQGPQ